MTQDKRMLWIRNLDAPVSKPTYNIEVELGSEVQIGGLLNYGNDAIICGSTTMGPDQSGLYKYVLRLRMPRRVTETDPPSEPLSRGTKKGYLFPDGPVGELVALLSLRLQARLYVLSIGIRGFAHHDDLLHKTEINPLRGRTGPQVDGVIFKSTHRYMDSDLFPFLNEIRKIPPDHHLEVAVTADHYSKALREIGINDEMVFIRLVSAIERIAVHQKITNDLLDGINLDEVLRVDKLSCEQVEAIRKLFEVRYAKSRFIAFIKEYSQGFFDGEHREPVHTQVTPKNLQVVAAAVYDARSAYLHTGAPMYLSLGMARFPNWHMDPSLGMTWQGRSFNAKQKLPRADFFHRLVRHCILARMKKLSDVETC